VVRTMPNTAVLVGAGACGMVANARVDEVRREQAEAILRAVGVTVWVEREEQLDAVTALSGSGPAYFFLVMEALEQAAIAQGLTREQAQRLRAERPQLSPWRVVAMQIVAGVGVAVVAGLITRRMEVAWSALYGGATVVVPGALMARGMTSRLSSMSAGTGAVSFMLWEFVKIAVSVVMLVLANRIVQPLSWPALLVGLVVCMKVYWLALLWRR